jgi:uncharacterized RDD family membrane protein YckC
MSAPTSFTDQLNIETPEQVDLHLPIAGIGSRFLAILADTIVQFIALVVLFLALALFGFWMDRHPSSAAARSPGLGEKWAIALIVFFFFLLYWGYFSLFEAFWNGQTPGKRFFKIRVIKDSGRQITLFESLARNLLRVVDMQLGYLVGVIAILCNREQKRLGDFVAGTIVVHDRTVEQPVTAHNSRTFTEALYRETPVVERLRPDTVDLPADAIARLGPQDLHVIETFLGRVLDLALSTRDEMALRIATRMAQKMAIPLPEGLRPETFLEEIAFRMRSQARI